MKRIRIEGPCDLTVSVFGRVTIKGIDPDRAVAVIRRSWTPEYGDMFIAEEAGKPGRGGSWRPTAEQALAALFRKP